MEKNHTEASTKRRTIKEKYKALEVKIKFLLDEITRKKIKNVSDDLVYKKELQGFLDLNNIMIVKKEDGKYCIKNGERGKKTEDLSEEMVQGLKLLGHYIKQDYEERDTADSIVADLQKIINKEENLSDYYEVLEVNSIKGDPNKIAVTVIDKSGNIIENVILPIAFTKYINQNNDYVQEIENKISDLLKEKEAKLDGILNRLLKDIDSQYRNNQEKMSFREKFLKEPFTQEQIIDKILNELREKRKNFEQEIKNYKLIRQDDGIYLKCHNVTSKLPDTMVKKLKLLGFYDEKETSLIEEVFRKTIKALTINKEYHDKEYLTPEGSYISEISTMGDLLSDSDKENGEKISILDGVAVCVSQEKKKELFKKKDDKEQTTDLMSVPVQYEFIKMITQNRKDAFSSEMNILETIKELFLHNTQLFEINSRIINKRLEERELKLKIQIKDGKTQFVAQRGNKELLIDRVISQNILEYMKSEIKTIAEKKSNSNEDKPKIEKTFSINEREFIEYLCKIYRFLEELNKRGYKPNNNYIPKAFYIPKGKSTEIIRIDSIPNRTSLELPYGIGEELQEINEVFNQVIQAVPYFDLSEMIKCIQKSDGLSSNLEKYMKFLISLSRINRYIIGPAKGAKSAFKRLISTQPPTKDAEQYGLVPSMTDGVEKGHTDNIIDVDDKGIK